MPARRRLAQTRRVKTTLLLLLLALIAPLAWLAWRRLRSEHPRARAIREVLDAADALEARLRVARGEIEAVAGDHENPVQGAMRDLLRQRLWLQEHAHDASLQQLADVRASMDQARASLEQQLSRVELARQQGA